MPYITREDGEHLVIPSYRDVLLAKQKAALKKEILLLSQSYGEYITLQRKSATQYEVAFSPDTGYLLGESIWHFFKRPLDMIYCEAIPNTTEAILVIVKAGSVYLDGSFPLESIPEELVIFLTQQNNFEIYIHGDVPISETPEEGKFSFEPGSVKSFAILEQPIFPTLPLLKQYQLQLVEVVLKEHGIGVFPTRQIIIGIVVLGLLWMGWSYLTSRKVELPQVIPQMNPYQAYNDMLSTPAPDQEFAAVIEKFKELYSIPGWQPTKMDYSDSSLNALLVSMGGKAEDLFKWATTHNANMNVTKTGMYILMQIELPKREVPTKIYPIKQVIAVLVDRLSPVYPGNHFELADFVTKGPFTQVQITIRLDNVYPGLLPLIAEQLKDLPIMLQSVSLTVSNGVLSGGIVIQAAGS